MISGGLHLRVIKLMGHDGGCPGPRTKLASEAKRDDAAKQRLPDLGGTAGLAATETGTEGCGEGTVTTKHLVEHAPFADRGETAFAALVPWRQL
ncbi:hypothetical protein [Mesorhizobium sp. WSM4904]|uniref:hypothetical protein n=1 Tax=Mesorhizobium sp. WSM4904 TaxID=3038545 RepID=UPI0024185456|nr:hypothetical protein [Mesorhizobium sp. WSM4904]WFP65824.1 hypothetical protein QAZ47_15385 [Mesorhizobium sp. WSM4904]